MSNPVFAKEFRSFLLALGFFTRIPVPHYENFAEAELNYATKYFPLIGIIVGLVGAIVYLVSAQFLPQSIAVLLSMVSTIYVTGAFHEDGLADSADGLGGGWEREKILVIMQDSRLGTYGAVALFLMLFTKFQLLNSLSNDLIALALVAAHAVSRLSAVWIMATLGYAKPVGKAKPLATQISLPDLCIASIIGLLPFLVFIVLVQNNRAAIFTIQLVVMTIVPIVLIWLWWRNKIKKWLDGYTGDTLGAMQQLAELAFYFGLVLWSANT